MLFNDIPGTSGYMGGGRESGELRKVLATPQLRQASCLEGEV